MFVEKHYIEETDVPVDVYNFQVEDHHTYFVGECCAWVHNKNCPPHMNEDGTLKNDIKKIADTYNAFVEGTLEDEKGFCAVVTTQDIAKQDYILTPGRYVGIEEQEDDGEPFEEKMGRLTSELSELFTKSHELEAQIKARLGAIGYEI